jgi:hypothetical protein
VCGFKAKECKKRKGELHGGCSSGKSEGNTNNGGSGKTCHFCGLKGHKETGCFKKFPKKALAWYCEGQISRFKHGGDTGVTKPGKAGNKYFKATQ